MELSKIILLIRFGEIALKSNHVRKRMENLLVRNISVALKKMDFKKTNVQNYRQWSRILVTRGKRATYEQLPKYNEIAEYLANHVPGITSVSPAITTTAELDDIAKTSLFLAEKTFQKGFSFAVRARRTGEHPYRSIDLERKIGGHLFEHLQEKMDLTVNLDNPDITLGIEVRDQNTFIFTRVYQAIGGLPQGTQGNLGAILRGSLQDALAAFLLSKRGMIPIPIVFLLESEHSKFQNEIAIKKQLDFLKYLSPFENPFYYKVNFSFILEQIGFNRLTCSICDRVCTRIAQKIVQKESLSAFSVGNEDFMLRNRLPVKMPLESSPPLFYPLITLNEKDISSPLPSLASSFCFSS
ncbi:hypothetical protein EU523_00305, partial [Candidatus Heimdallarchaeota archaeon]